MKVLFDINESPLKEFAPDRRYSRGKNTTALLSSRSTVGIGTLEYYLLVAEASSGRSLRLSG
jgi:hypothetical protein